MVYSLSIFETILLLLVIGIIVTSTFNYIKLPAIVGYIFVGLLVGPYTTNLLTNSENLQHVAEFGIVFLMFTIGLEFSLARMIAIKKIVFVYGGIQVLLSTLLTALISVKFEMTLPEILVVSGIIALSSTAIVLKQLTEQGELHHRHGLNALGILLFQDLAVIPLLILIPRLQNIEFMGLVQEITWASLKGFLAFSIILIIGRWVLRPVYYYIAQSRSLELFTLLSLFITLSAAWLTQQFGLSLALGAFLAGMMLGETEFRHQIETDIRPFKDVLLGFFFISVGMQLDIKIIFYALPWVLLLLLALIIFKGIIIACICYFFERSKKEAIQTGICLAQGSEFGFAILTSAMHFELLRPEYAQVILCALLMSMALAPILINHNTRIAHWLFPQSKKTRISDLENVANIKKNLSNHVIICGYGRVGQIVARFLKNAQIKFLALDMDASLVKDATLAGENVVYADATNHEVLSLMNLHQAKALVICFHNVTEACKMVNHTRSHFPKLPIIIRAHDEVEADLLYDHNATEVIAETFEASLMLASQLLLFLNIPPQKVSEWVNESRNDRYDLLRMVFPSKVTLNIDDEPVPTEGLYTVILNESAYSLDHKISDFSILIDQVKVATIRRENQKLINPLPNTILRKDDIIVLYGPFQLLERAERILLEGE